MKFPINLFTASILLTSLQTVFAYQVKAEPKAPALESGVIRVNDRPIVSQNADLLSQSPIVPTPTPEETEEELVVTGTRTPRAAKTTPGTITVFDGKYLDNNYIQNIQDLIRYEPGVSVQNRPTRAGNAGFTIRGISGNRVFIQVDGIRIPDSYFNSGRDVVDFDAIKRVEIIRGPASTLYGSDAIGGVVSYISKDPQDYLKVFNRDFYISGRSAFESSSNAFAETLTIAAGKDKLSGLLIYTRRDANQPSVLGNRSPNPQILDTNNILAKLVYDIDPKSSLRLTGEFRDNRTETNILSSLGILPGPPGSRLAGQTAIDYARRDRISLDYKSDNTASNETGISPLLQRIQAKVYHQNAETIEDTLQSRFSGTSARRRVQNNKFQQNIFGIDAQAELAFKTGQLNHRLAFGIDYSTTSTSRPRDNSEITIATGVINKTVAGEVFPNKTFPDTTTNRFRVYAQDEIEWGNFTLIPAISYDVYNLTPRSGDPDFDRINISNYSVSPISASKILPSLKAIAKLTPELALYGQYARGFRSPPYDDATTAFTNFAQGYTVLPNGSLKPESSDNFELGLKYSNPRFSGSIAGFYNRYTDFIDTVQIGTTRIGGQSLRQFQSKNTLGAEIYGVEAKAEYRFSGKPEGFSAFGTIAFADGNNLETNQALNSIDPWKLVTGLRYQAPKDQWGADLIASIVGQKSRFDLTSTPTQFKPPGFATVDLVSYYTINPNTKINLGIYNLLNAKVWNWSDVNGLAASDPTLDLYTQPGISAAASIRVQF